MLLKGDGAPGKGAYLVLWAALAVICFLGVGRSLWTPDEPREAEIAREMAARPGMIPELNGQPFYEKPPLYYWIVAAAFALGGGPSAEAARAVSGLAGLLTLVALFFWAKRAHSSRAGITAVILLATTGAFFISTHWVRLDALLAFVTTVVFWSAWEVANRGGGVPLATVYFALALSLWTKGLVGPALVGAGLMAWFVLERARKPWQAFKPLLGAGLCLAAVGVLGALIYAGGGREALWQWAWVNHVQRFLDPGSKGHAQPIYEYAVYLPLAVFPWLMPALGIFRPAFWREGAPARGLKRFCGTVVAAGLVLLSLASSKRQVYLLPLMPPLCLLIALSVIEWLEARSARAEAERRAGPMAWLNAILLALVGAVPAAALLFRLRSFSPGAVISLALALVAGAGAVVSLRRLDLRRAAACAAASAGICTVSLLVLLMPAIDSEKDFGPIISWIDAQLAPSQPVYAMGADETLRGIVPFMTGRSLVEVEAGSLKQGEAGDGTPLPEFLVFQQVKGAGIEREVTSGYDLLRRMDIGPRRSISLWRLKPR